MNVEWLARLPRPVRRGLYFALQAAIGSRIGRVWREFLAWERFTPQQLEQSVDTRLAALLDHATRHSEHYRHLGVGTLRSGEGPREWLKRFPVLTRDLVRTEFHRLVVDALRSKIPGPQSVSGRGYDWLVVKTGGSTGVPTSVVHDALGRDSGRATRLYALRACGFPLGVRHFRLWGSEDDLLNRRRSLQQRVLGALHAETPLNAFRATEQDLHRHYRSIRSQPRIRHLMAYVDAAAGLARFITDRGLDPPRLESIMACAGTVTTDYRVLLTRVFGAQVFDKYGSRECSDMACECGQHAGLHVLSPHAFLEVVDERARPCPPGVGGRLLVTLLNNRSFPMIRYDIGDWAVWSAAGPCPCGCPFPRIQEVLGRQDDMLITADGTRLTSVFVRHIVGVSLNRQLIWEWQLEQRDRSRFSFRYIPANQDGLEENLAVLRVRLADALGGAPEIEFQAVTQIPPTASGKVRWVISNCPD